MSRRAPDALVDFPGVGRIFRRVAVAGLGDAAPGGRVRLDALARWIQDVAHADVCDAGLQDRALWVVRRARMLVRRFPQFGEPVALETFASGAGRLCAERRTTITTDAGGHVEAVAVWVHLDPVDGRPRPLDVDELAVYGPSSAGRAIKTRLRHPDPAPDGQDARRWTFRAAELDLADHINNAAYWTVLEEELTGRAASDGLDAEIEFRTPAQPGEHTVLAADAHRWIVGRQGTVHASIALAAPAADHAAS